MMNQKRLIITLLFFFAYLSKGQDNSQQYQSEIAHHTSFGNCPTHLVGKLVLSLLDVYSKEHSLLKLKIWMKNNLIQEKNFITHFQIKYNPFKKQLDFNFSCPTPILRINYYEDRFTRVHQQMLLTNEKELVDPLYLYHLRSDKRFLDYLPEVSIVESENAQKQLENLVDAFGQKKYLESVVSEIKITQKGKMSIIVSLKELPVLVKIGEENWNEKFNQLEKILKFMDEKNKIPSLINLEASNKIIVKF